MLVLGRSAWHPPRWTRAREGVCSCRAGQGTEELVVCKEWVLEPQVWIELRKEASPRGRVRLCPISRHGCSSELWAVTDSSVEDRIMIALSLYMCMVKQIVNMLFNCSLLIIRFSVFPPLGLVLPAIRPHVRLQHKTCPYILHFLLFPQVLCEFCFSL